MCIVGYYTCYDLLDISMELEIHTTPVVKFGKFVNKGIEQSY